MRPDWKVGGSTTRTTGVAGQQQAGSVTTSVTGPRPSLGGRGIDVSMLPGCPLRSPGQQSRTAPIRGSKVPDRQVASQLPRVNRALAIQARSRRRNVKSQMSKGHNLREPRNGAGTEPLQTPVARTGQGQIERRPRLSPLF